MAAVAMCCLAALEVPKIAEYLDVSVRTVLRDLEEERLQLIDPRG